MKKNLVLGLAVGLLSILNVDAAQAVSLRFTPESQTVNLGKTVSVGIEISELGEQTLGTYDLTIEFEPDIIQFQNIIFSEKLSDVDFPSIQVVTDLENTVNLYEVSFLESVPLEALQGNSFILATLIFNTKKVGNSYLKFLNSPDTPLILGEGGEFFTDIKPLSLTNELSDGYIIVTTRTTVPEPSMLISIGALATYLEFRLSSKKRRSKAELNKNRYEA